MKIHCALFLALASALVVADDNCQKDVTVNSQEDLNQVSGCKSYSGSITIDGAPVANLNLAGVQQISGDLTIQNNGGLTSVVLPNLQSVGKLTLFNNTALTAITMGSLKSLDAFVCQNNPRVNTLTFTRGVPNLETFQIIDSSVATLPLLNFTSITNLELYGNRNLTNITLNNLSQVNGYISIVNNNREVTVSLPQLSSVGQNCTFANVQELSVPSLQKVKSNLNINDNQFKNFTMDKLESVASSVSIINNANLEAFSFAALTEIGGNLLVVNNTEIGALDGFPSLKAVDGSIDVRGTFANVSFDDLQDVKGGFNIMSTKGIDCSKLTGDYGSSSVTGGTWNCKDKSSTSDVTSTDNTESTSAALALRPIGDGRVGALTLGGFTLALFAAQQLL
ncbi:cell wall protein Ecm33 [Tieghemiomyces parasiticus]|uniref:Cell wall protein Ecm33 n=1 Tax=Tieghemiomyces parasiticus TaxID=78921 RepID=A0A9W8AJD8_9FUNG|nr:cell wall protein Ecm33 [Tieghemiomyces parasiticus]